jgi:aminopeptidase YwaD
VAALCAHPDRSLGSEGNAAAGEYFCVRAAEAGLRIQRFGFDCVRWDAGDATLVVSDRRFALSVAPYSLGCDAAARLTSAASLDELANPDLTDSILLLHGALAAEQVFPKNYPYVSFPAHQALIAALEHVRPAAIVALTGSETARPFALFEDADFDVASAFPPAEDGDALLALVGEEARLRIDSVRSAATGEQPVATCEGDRMGRIVVSAHFDTKHDTPGALDNASGVAILLALADLLGPSRQGRSVELVAFNGEDDYSAAGEVTYFVRAGVDGTALAINIDGAAWRDHDTVVSWHGCPRSLETALGESLDTRGGFSAGPMWPMSDHMIFAGQGVPVVAITSDIESLVASVAHTPADTPDLVDPEVAARIARFVLELVETADRLL